MIAAISWVPKGVLKSIPAEAELPSKEEIEEIVKSGFLERGEPSESEEENGNMDADAAEQVDEVAHALAAADALGKASKGAPSVTDNITDALKELDMDSYDDEDDGIALFSARLGDTYYPRNDMDPYLKDNEDDDDSEDLEDITIRAEDAVLVCARNEDDVSHLEVWIVEDPATDGDSNMYVHHDIMFPAFPLCTAWIDCRLKCGKKGNFIAVGSKDPAIEIWDLDVLDEVQPSMVLGGFAEKKKKGKKKSIKYKKTVTLIQYLVLIGTRSTVIYLPVLVLIN